MSFDTSGRTGWGDEAQHAPAPPPAHPEVSKDRSSRGIEGEVSKDRSFLAFDFGTARVGVASGNTITRSAQPMRTIAEAGTRRFEAIGKLIAEWQPDALVVGVPFHPDGAAHENTTRARRFARQLHGRFGLPVHEVDERYTTTEALAMGAADVDAASAAIILEQFLGGLE